MAGYIPISRFFKEKAEAVAQEMSSWEDKPRIDEETEVRIRDSVRSFTHAVQPAAFRMGGVDGSGDYPSLSYGDAFVHVATAWGAIFRTDPLRGLIEDQGLLEPNFEVVFLPEDRDKARELWHQAFTSLSGIPVGDVISESDYRMIKRVAAGGSPDPKVLLDGLVLPRSSDTTNCGIQLRSSAEWGAALRLIAADPACRYILMDTTLSLPFVRTRDESLFHEHLKRLCCVRARERGIALFTISKSHGMPAIELIEGLACDALGLGCDRVAQHWFLRLPVPGIDDWEFPLIEGRQIPPAGAVSFLFRLHKNTPVMRLDMDRSWWEARYRDDAAAERGAFEDLDYCGHDQRAFGYPFPIKACHDRARLSRSERLVLKKEIIDAAVARGMKRSLFKDVSAATGHA